MLLPVFMFILLKVYINGILPSMLQFCFTLRSTLNLPTTYIQRTILQCMRGVPEDFRKTDFSVGETVAWSCYESSDSPIITAARSIRG